MPSSSKVRKEKKQERDLDDLDIQERRGWVNFVRGNVKKVGRKVVLSSDKGSEFYWLKKQYEKLIDHAQEARMKRMPTKLAGDGENPLIALHVYLPEVNGK